MNRYLYAEANPATLIDPTGHMTADVNGGRADYQERRACYSAPVCLTPRFSAFMCFKHNYGSRCCRMPTL